MNATPLSPPNPGATPFPCLQQGDVRALEAIARRLLGCSHLAQDAVQEALLALSQQPTAPERPLAWLAKAVIHRCRHLRRTLRRRRHHEHIATQHCDLHEDCNNPLHVAMAHELGETLAAVRASLPREQRVVLDLYETQDVDYHQIATALGIPIGTVRSRLARARQALQTALALKQGIDGAARRVPAAPSRERDLGSRPPVPRSDTSASGPCTLVTPAARPGAPTCHPVCSP